MVVAPGHAHTPAIKIKSKLLKLISYLVETDNPILMVVTLKQK